MIIYRVKYYHAFRSAIILFRCSGCPRFRRKRCNRSKLFNGKNNFYFDETITDESVNKFKEFVNEISNSEEPLFIFISTNGGDISSAQMISSILLNWKGETNAVILHKAFSAGTLIALCCKNIYMHHNAHIFPTDVMIMTSLFDYTQLTSLSNVIANKNPDKIDDQIYILADQAKKNKLILNKIFEKISILHGFDSNVKNNIYDNLFGGEKYAHNTTFSLNDIVEMGINVLPPTKDLIKLSKLLHQSEYENCCK